MIKAELSALRDILTENATYGTIIFSFELLVDKRVLLTRSGNRERQRPCCRFCLILS